MFEDIIRQAEETNKEAAEAMKFAKSMFLSGEYSPFEYIETMNYIKKVYVNS